MKEYLFNKKNIIYIICHDQYIYNLALIQYSIYKWAKPIIIKYIDYTFENVIWIKLNEIQSEWENTNIVGILPYFCFKHLNLNIVDNIISKKLYLPKNYYHFNNIHSSIFNNNNFSKTWRNILNLFDYKESNDNNCYYFICTPLLMKKFIIWYNDICLSKLINNPILLENTNFIVEKELIKIWSNKYYPIYPFIIERLTKYFFDNLIIDNNNPEKIVINTPINDKPEKVITDMKSNDNTKIETINNYIINTINNINNINKAKLKKFEIITPIKNSKMINPIKNFRIICNDYIDYIKKITLPIINKNCKNEAVLIEFNCLPHIEFIIRNTIIKLGHDWGHTIICGNLNYNFIVKLCSSISINIKIIKIDCDNINQVIYKNLIASNSFWKLFNSEKIFLYREDSCLFYDNIQLHKSNFYNNTFNLSNKTIYNSNSLCLYNSTWEQLLLTQSIITFKLYKKILTEHRGGWNTIIYNLYKTKIINNTSSNIFLDIIEKYFLWDNNKVIKKKWSGIIHCTPITPPYLKNINIRYLFKNKNFIESLNNCYCIFTLSNYVTKFLEKEFNKINVNIKIFTLKHPIETSDIIYFNLEDYFNNPNKKLIQLGQQLRKVTSIYLLPDINNHEKIWLPGTQNFKYCDYLLNNEGLYFSLDISKSRKDSIKMYYTNTIKEFDILLSQNIIFVDLFDAAANNTVLECIVRNTPLIIRKIEGVVEYLGEDYPLYFTKLSQITNLIKTENIIKAHEYLKNMDKSDININYFINNLINKLMSLKI